MRGNFVFRQMVALPTSNSRCPSGTRQRDTTTEHMPQLASQHLSPTAQLLTPQGTRVPVAVVCVSRQCLYEQTWLSSEGFWVVAARNYSKFPISRTQVVAQSATWR